MGDASILNELAERCERALGPDEELDALIRCAAYAPPNAYVERSRFNGTWCVYTPSFREGGRPQLFDTAESRGAFTASIDSAMQLMPQNGRWSLDSAGFYASVNGKSGAGATGALALCSAALRARAASLRARVGEIE